MVAIVRSRTALRGLPDAVNDLALDYVAEKRYVLGRVEKLHEPGACGQQTGRGLTDGNAAPLRRGFRFGQFLTIKDLAHDRHVETK